jgi:mannosyltransferase OCH1-like enzyme
MNKYYKLLIIIILIVLYFIVNLNYKYNYILPSNDDFNIFKNYYDIKELIHLHTYNNELKNINIKIPKYIKPRNDIPILNKYELIKNDIIFDDYHFVIYYLNEYNCKIIVRRLDSYKINSNFSIKIYDISNDNFEIINFNDYNQDQNINEIIIEYQTKIKLEKVIYQDIKIPKVIIQTGNSDEINLAQYNTILTFIELNPEFTYIYFDDNDIEKFLINNFDESIINAYNAIKPGAYKADLFRYCYIYINGGCYFDNKMINRLPIREVINIDDEIIFCKDAIENQYYNAILISIKNHIIFKNCINECVYNINNKLYNKNRWDITGPALLYRWSKDYPFTLTLINTSKSKCDLIYNILMHKKLTHKKSVKVNKLNKIFLNTQYYEYYDKYINFNNYTWRYILKKVY